MVNVIEKVNVNERIERITDFKKATKYIKNMSVKKEGLGCCGSVKRLALLPSTKILCAHKVGEKIYSICEDGVYVYTEGAHEKVAEVMLSKDCKVFDYNLDGSQCILVCDITRSFIIKESQLTLVTVPYSSAFSVIGDVMFVANGREIKFAPKSEIEEQKDAFHLHNNITLPQGAGDILFLTTIKKKLTVICENAVYVITALGEEIDYTVEKIHSMPLKVLKGTVARFGDQILFVSKGKLYSLENNSIKDLGALLFDKESKVFSSCAIEGEYIVLCSNNEGDERYIYTYELHDGTESKIFGTFNGIFDQGIILESSCISSYKSVPLLSPLSKWKSVEFNFSYPDKKTLTALSVQTKEDIIVIISGDFGIKELKFLAGYTTKKLNLSSTTFELTITSEKEISITAITFNYALKGGK